MGALNILWNCEVTGEIWRLAFQKCLFRSLREIVDFVVRETGYYCHSDLLTINIITSHSTNWSDYSFTQCHVQITDEKCIRGYCM